MAIVDDELQQALGAHRAGDLARAETLYRQVLARAPRHAEAWHLAGLAALQRGDAGTALSRLDAAIAVRDDIAGFHTHRGRALFALDRTAPALTAMQRAFRLDPNDGEVVENLVTGLTLARRWPEAEQAARALVRLRPEDALARARLAETLRGLGQLDDAQIVYQEAVRLAPDDAELRASQAAALQFAGSARAAEAAYRAALDLRPEYAEARANLASLLRDRGELAEARDLFDAALRARPELTTARAGRIALLQRHGETAAAGTALSEACRAFPDDPHLAVPYLDLAERLGQVDEALAYAGRALARDDASRGARQQIHFARARLVDGRGDGDAAFADWLAANALTQRRYDPAHQENLCDSLIAAYGDLEALAKSNVADARMVFIVGMPRSGTSLLEQALASHPQLCGAGELEAMHTAARELSRRFGIDGPAAIRAARPGDLDELAAAYLGEAVAEAGPEAETARRISDKMPNNILFVGLIARVLPNAAIVHMRRDPLDTCLSCFQQNFGERLPQCAELTALGHYYGQYRRLAAHWHAVLGARFAELDYEALVADLEGEMRRILGQIGLDWDPAVLRFHENPRFVRTASHAQVRQPLYGDAIGRWRRYRAHLGPLFEALEQAGVAFSSQ